MRYAIFSLVMAVFIGITGCSNNDNPSNPPETGELALNISGLKDLGSAAKYEGWIIVNGTPKSTGKFTVDANGQLSSNTFTVDKGVTYINVESRMIILIPD